MNIGLISDLHGNLQALRATLAWLDTHGVDLVLCAGDLVCYGAHPNEVIGELIDRSIPCVAGNYDDAAAWDKPRAARQPSSPLNEPLKLAALAWTKRRLRGVSLRFLRHLPWMLQFQPDGLRICMLHGGPQHLDEVYSPEAPEALEDLANRLPADIVVLGHTHQPFVHRSGPTLFVNPGAVGRSLDGDPRASCALFDTGTREASLHRVEYNIAAATEAIARSGMPPAIAAMVRQGARRLEDVHDAISA
jgi:putative phosphoesterase